MSVNARRIALALALGAAGGAVFFLLHLPLPWMLGALFCTMSASLAGVRLTAPARVRPGVVAVIGVLLGANFKPELLQQAPEWGLSLLGLALFLLLAVAIVLPWYRKVGGFDARTAYFAAMPGGLSEMIELGEAAGANVPKIILAQSLRIVTTIALIAIWFRWWLGLAVGSNASSLWEFPGWLDLAMLGLAAVIGSWVGIKLRLPAPTLMGPMVVSAILHLVNLTQSAPPAVLVIGAQIILGTILGSRFQGMKARVLLPALGLSFVATLAMLGMALGFALVLERLTGQSSEQILLAYAPGGLTEMSLVALALHAEVAFVALHHVVRILMVIGCAPIVFRLWLK
ncbi:AbrB family transcriptional regulator [Gemmobacter serpentinus]|uniref:AbrB family transcriptional regulator n=1 Tax=Gemmobacter serpentinus TaxID=2652247 RepID=UPI001CF65689|nr:AbrB family transcriptional regulator [Gemmobacter serpentinus]